MMRKDLSVRGVLMFFILVALIGCSKPTAQSLYEKAQGEQAAKLYDDALTTYRELIQLYPDSSHTPAVYYAVGFIYQNYKNDARTALGYYRTLVKNFPQHPTAANAAFLVGFLYANELHEYDSARLAYEHFLQNYPNSPAGLLESARAELKTLGKDPTTILAEAQKQNEQQRLKKK